MKLHLLSTLVGPQARTAFGGCCGLVAALAIAACATSPSALVLEGQPDGGPGGLDGGDASGPAPDDDDVTKQPPHSLGTITLGETHVSATGTTPKPTAIVAASFFPDALLTKQCRKSLEAGCYIQEIPKCTKVTTTSNGCNTGELCKYDDACKPACVTTPTCSTACKEDEVCEASLGTSGVCTKKPVFDAGVLAFSGTTTPITLYPPYTFDPTGAQGAPFLAGVDLRVQGAGAVEAGFEKFDEQFKATSFIQMNPQLAKIGRDKIFGTGALPVVWTPGEDQVVISITSLGGTATCKVDDKPGKFDVPRTVVKAALGTPAPGTETAAQSLSLSVARVRKEVKKTARAKGTLGSQKVIPEGWLELTTMSTESGSFTGCASTQTVCAETCCSSGYTCDNGTCKLGGGTTCESCLTTNCSTYNSACTADSYCSALKSCIAACTTTSCQTSCRSTYAAGTTKYDQLNSCKTSFCTSSCP